LNGLFVRLLGLRCLASYGFPKGAAPIVEYRAEDGVAALVQLRAMSSLRGRALQNTYELAIGGRNQDAIQLALLHISGHLLKCDVRAKSTWPRLHHLFNELLGTTVQSMPLQQAKHNALLVHHHGALPPRGPDMLGHLAQAVRQAAGRYIASYALPNAGNTRPFPLRWQATGLPVYLSRHVVKYLGEAEAFEPPRGSGAQVST
jgi:hypothetical protein